MITFITLVLILILILVFYRNHRDKHKNIMSDQQIKCVGATDDVRPKITQRNSSKLHTGTPSSSEARIPTQTLPQIPQSLPQIPHIPRTDTTYTTNFTTYSTTNTTYSTTNATCSTTNTTCSTTNCTDSTITDFPAGIINTTVYITKSVTTFTDNTNKRHFHHQHRYQKNSSLLTQLRIPIDWKRFLSRKMIHR